MRTRHYLAECTPSPFDRFRVRQNPGFSSTREARAARVPKWIVEISSRRGRTLDFSLGVANGAARELRRPARREGIFTPEGRKS